MHVLLYVLLLSVIACGPQKSQEPPAPQNTKNQDTIQNPLPAPSKDNPTPTQKNTPEEPAPAQIVNPTQNIPPEAPVLQLNEPLTEVQSILDQLEGNYRFDLDVYQEGWSNFWRHLSRSSVPVSLSLLRNPRPQTEQLLTYVLSEGSPNGQFCTVHSNFITQDDASIDLLVAEHSISNNGRIADLYSTKNFIHVFKSTDRFKVWFLGDNNSEEVMLILPNNLYNEENAKDFDSLCRSCGFEIGQNGLCQQKQVNI